MLEKKGKYVGFCVHRRSYLLWSPLRNSARSLLAGKLLPLIRIPPSLSIPQRPPKVQYFFSPIFFSFPMPLAPLIDHIHWRRRVPSLEKTKKIQKQKKRRKKNKTTPTEKKSRQGRKEKTKTPKKTKKKNYSTERANLQTARSIIRRKKKLRELKQTLGKPSPQKQKQKRRKWWATLTSYSAPPPPSLWHKPVTTSSPNIRTDCIL